MTKGRVAAFLAAAIAFIFISQTASAQYPPPEGHLICTIEVEIKGTFAFTASLRDSDGNSLGEGHKVFFEIVSHDGDASLSDDVVVTNENGDAQVDVKGGGAGQLVVSATSEEGLECRAVAQVTGSLIRAPSTGDGGLVNAADSLSVERMPLVAAAVMLVAIASSIWMVARKT
jgi:hypothetical protein